MVSDSLGSRDIGVAFSLLLDEPPSLIHLLFKTGDVEQFHFLVEVFLRHAFDFDVGGVP